MTIDNPRWVDELEKGAVLCVAPEHRLSGWRGTILSLCVKAQVMISIVLVLWLWHHSAWTFVFPPTSHRPMEGIPSYVFTYAPLVWLDKSEAYFPSDIGAQVQNTHPDVNFSAVADPPSPLTLDNLDALNTYGNEGLDVFLTSKIDVTTSPTWLDGVVPDSTGKTDNAVSCAIVVNDRGSGRVDAFYMYFYAYNMGNTVLFHELGDHVGDWEHNMIRFQDGKPTTMWFSQHANGEAFTYKSVEKQGIRPFSYSARGSHANYAIAGTHDHTIPDLNLPAGFLQDYTSRGKLWDPTLSAYLYTFDGKSLSFSSVGGSPVGAMNYRGRWGDKQYPKSDKRQSEWLGFYKFVDGPTGPWDKQLNRTKICPDNGILCIIRKSLGP